MGRGFHVGAVVNGVNVATSFTDEIRCEPMKEGEHASIAAAQ
jgi:hypothetical protein